MLSRPKACSKLSQKRHGRRTPLSSRVSYADLFGLIREPSEQPSLAPGDVVATGDSDWPRYTVVAVSNDKAWLRDVHNLDDSVITAGRCRLIERHGGRKRAG
jgi:hypothetical protein